MHSLFRLNILKVVGPKIEGQDYPHSHSQPHHPEVEVLHISLHWTNGLTFQGDEYLGGKYYKKLAKAPLVNEAGKGMNVRLMCATTQPSRDILNDS